MSKFLKEIAENLVNTYGYDLAGHVLVFPNRRSSLFFARYLASFCDRPVWAPEMVTINDLLTTRSDLKKAEPLTLVFELFAVYSETMESAGSFDEFYFWGEMLVNDFDDIDKYLVDPLSVFSNLLDIKDIDERFGGLDEEVLAVIKKFWVNFDPGRMTSEKADFLSIWSKLNSLYNGFRQRLREKGIGYDGMIVRDLAESTLAGADWTESNNLYHIIGINALNRCEQVILDDLKKRGRAKFYWDYDEFYIKQANHEAGFFLRDNISRYGGEEIPSASRDSLLNISFSEKDWKVINAPSDVAQAKLIPGILSEMDNIPGNQPDHTAIILADENMLIPVLNSIPSVIEDINITMGYPLYQTPVYSLVNHLIRLQKNITSGSNGDISFYHVDVLNLLKHQYFNTGTGEDNRKIMSRIREFNLIRVNSSELAGNELFEAVFRKVSDVASVNSYLREILLIVMSGLSDESVDKSPNARGKLQMEYIYSLVTSLNQLEDIFNTSSISMGLDIYGRILDRIIRKVMVPFAGEPLSGLQVMGILETRLLDFENLIILSVNEGVFPKGTPQNSYIPYNLRVAFGLPTVKHQDSIFAYYFYRLLQRAKRVRFIYNSSSSGLKTGEMSRFLLQLKYNPRLEPKFADSRFIISPSNRFTGTIRKNELITGILAERYIAGGGGRGLSPSAINTWINCSMRFYYRYVAGLKEREEVTAEVDSPLFGNILHITMKMIYSPWVGKVIEKKEIDSLAGNKTYINEIVARAFGQVFLHGKNGEISGRNRIIVSILEKIVRQLLLIDSRLAPVTIIALEKEYYTTIPVESGGNRIIVSVGGTIDRVDIVSGVTRILDYKSGNDNLAIGSLGDLTAYNSTVRNSAAFQTLLYCELYSNSASAEKVRPSLYPVRQIFDDEFSDLFYTGRGNSRAEIVDYKMVRDDFMAQLGSVVSDIFNPGFDFSMTADRQKCKYCPYSGICEREDLK